MTKTLLDLDTLVVRPKISIDGTQYEILSPDELPVLTTHKFGIKGSRLDELMAKAELDAGEEAELGNVLREISETIMEPVPPAIRDKLSDAHRLEVVQTFSTLLLNKNAGTAAALLKTLLPALAQLKEQSPPIGEKPSPGSSASTGARQGGGSRKRRSRS